MPRRKKKNHRTFEQPVSREQRLKDRCSSLGWQVPFHLRSWEDHFISQSSYMHEFERWMAEKCRMGGAYVKVIVDIEDPYGNSQPDEYEEAWNDYWTQGKWSAPQQAQSRCKPATKWQWGANVLPMEHKIEAPSGETGKDLVCI